MRSERAFTLLEILVVIGIVAFVYTIALPNIAVQTGTEVAKRLGRLSEDVRAAYDQAVLSGHPHRLVFKLMTGDYWLEATDSPSAPLGDRLFDGDRLVDEEREAELKERFTRYEELAGEEFRDPESDEKIPPVSPVLKAREKLEGPKWYKVDSLEWQKRSLGELLMIKGLQAEHHERAVTVDDHGPEAVAMIYFLPSGYVEKAVIHIYYQRGDHELDPDKEPYTIVTLPYQGMAEVRSGYEEIDVRADEERS